MQRRKYYQTPGEEFMQFHHQRNLLICLFISLVLLPATTVADQLQMTNGDVISGTVSKVVDGEVYIKPAYAEEFAVSLAEVTSIQADQVFDVELADGSTMEAQFAGAPEGEQTLIVNASSMNIELPDLNSASEPGVELDVNRWEGSGELGFVNTTGNTETVALNMKLNFIRNGPRWRHRFTGTAMNTSEDGEQDNERYTLEVQSDRKLSEISWLFGAFRWDADKFGSYDPQLSLTAGYGRQLMLSEKHELKGEVGAGYRKLEETLTGNSSSELIGRFLLDDWWQILPSTKWVNRLLVETGSSNTFLQFNTGVAVSMSDRFGLNLGIEVRNNTKLPPGESENTDTITSANLVYSF
jgi:putative salt-induced outer membrane protein